MEKQNNVRVGGARRPRRCSSSCGDVDAHQRRLLFSRDETRRDNETDFERQGQRRRDADEARNSSNQRRRSTEAGLRAVEPATRRAVDPQWRRGPLPAVVMRFAATARVAPSGAGSGRCQGGPRATRAKVSVERCGRLRRDSVQRIADTAIHRRGHVRGYATAEQAQRFTLNFAGEAGARTSAERSPTSSLCCAGRLY